MHYELLLDHWWFTKAQLPADYPFDPTLLEEVRIPHTWNAIDGQDGGYDYHRGVCTYMTQFTLSVPCDRYGLRFEGVNAAATVYLNGHLIGNHVGGYSAFYVSCPASLLQPINTVLVHVDNTRRADWIPYDADFTFYGGIYRPVHLMHQSELAFDYRNLGARGIAWHQLEVTTDRALIRADVHLTEVEKPRDIYVTVEVFEEKSLVTSSVQIVRWHHAKVLSLPLIIHHPHRWQGMSDPFLYQMVITLVQDGHVVERQETKLGVRDIRIDGQHLLLNGEILHLQGVCRHQDRLDIGNALTLTHHKEDLAIIKEMGANAIRLAHYQQADDMYRLCDEMGFVVWAEIPYITQFSELDPNGDQPAAQLKELIAQNRHHVSIMMWGIQNELTLRGKDARMVPVFQRLTRIAHRMDSSRLVTQAQVGGLPVDDELNTLTDTLGYNQYFGWYYGQTTDLNGWLDRYHKANPTRPVMISEYGVDALETYHSNHPVSKDYTEEFQAWWHETSYRIMRSKPFVYGTFIWNMFTFGSDLRNEGGSQGKNNKGLVTFDRKLRKDAFYFYQASWTTTPMLHLCSQRYIDRDEAETIVKVYSNADEVRLFHNRVLIGPMKKDGIVYTLPLTLQPGANEIVVQSFDHCDKAVWILQDHPNPTYLPPDHTRKTTSWV